MAAAAGAAPRVVVLVPKGGTDLTRRVALPVKYAARAHALCMCMCV
jgi:hypothetical protein